MYAWIGHFINDEDNIINKLVVVRRGTLYISTVFFIRYRIGSRAFFSETLRIIYLA